MSQNASLIQVQFCSLTGEFQRHCAVGLLHCAVWGAAAYSKYQSIQHIHDNLAKSEFKSYLELK